MVWYEGLYQVSSFGKVRSLDREIFVPSSGKYREYISRRKGKLLRQQTDGHGRYWVNLSKDGKVRVSRVHRLVAEAFIPGASPDLEVCHNDGNNQNNMISNLRWDTHTENMHDIVKHGNHWQTKKSECPLGHLLSDPNIWHKLGHQRSCLACRKARNAMSTNERLEIYGMELISSIYYEKIMSGTLPGYFKIEKYLLERVGN